MFPITSTSRATYLLPTQIASFPRPADNRVTGLFQNVISTHNFEPSSLSIKEEVVSLTNLWKAPFEIFMTGFCGLLWAHSLSQVAFSGRDMYRQFNTVPDAERNRLNSVKEFLLKGISFGGLTANIATWANDIKAIALGAAASTVRTIGYGASCIGYSARVYKSCQEIIDQAERLGNASSEAERIRLRQKQLLSVLDLAAYGTAAIWAFLGFVGLVFGIAAPAALMGGLIGASFILAISAIFYRVHLSRLYPNTAPQTA